MDDVVGAPQESLDLDLPPHAPLGVASTTTGLALEVGMGVEEFVEIYGAGWHLLPEQAQDIHGEAVLLGEPGEPWHVAGEPYQIALRAQHDGVELGLPTGDWAGAGELHWHVGERQHVPGGPDHADAARAAIAELLRQRRRTFRYCRYCRSQTAPEQLLNPDTCYACGSEWFGVG